jgi:hypothetical protein
MRFHDKTPSVFVVRSSNVARLSCESKTTGTKKPLLDKSSQRERNEINNCPAIAVNRQKQQSVIPLPPRNVCSAHNHLCGFEQVSGLTLLCFSLPSLSQWFIKNSVLQEAKQVTVAGAVWGFHPFP